ncbi:MAG: serine protease, partial [Desulfovibrionales bacterium]|nr:serine protease [Desulfovibrionales bacterium]
MTKIKGGEDASIEDWPWVTAIAHHGIDPYRGQFCGGAMISPQWVITAAHCLADMAGMHSYEPGDTDLIIGSTNLIEGHGERITAAKFVIHPEYDWFTNESDVALIYMERAPEVSTTWAYIPVIQAEDPHALTKPGRFAWVVGWGALGPTGPFPYELQQASVPMVSQEQLIEAYSPDEFTITDNMMGAGLGDGSVDTCQGDSGGPLMVMNHYNDFKLAGVTSWGLQCGTSDVYGVYVRLSEYCDWVVEVTGMNDCAQISQSGGSG